MDTDIVRLSKETARKIDEELIYQNTLPRQHYVNPRANKIDQGLAAQILVAEEYIAKARSLWAVSADERQSLAALRKVAAAAIRALERFGCPERPQPCSIVENRNRQQAMVLKPTNGKPIWNDPPCEADGL